MKHFLITEAKRDLYAYILAGQGMHTDAIDLKALKPIEPMTENLDAAAKVLAEAFDYPWDHMPEQGRNTMRGHVKDIIKATGLSHD